MTNEERHQEAVNRYNQNPKTCAYCGKLLPYEKRTQRYCSISCGATHRNLTIVKDNYTHRSPEERKAIKREYAKQYYQMHKHGQEKCVVCGCLFIKTNNKQDHCKSCRNKLQSFMKVSNDIEYHRTSDHSTVHRNLVKQNGWELLKTDVVHHIDGDRRNNDESNLLVLNIVDHNKLHRFIAEERFKGSTETLKELALRFLIESGVPYGYGKPPTELEIQQMDEENNL